MKQEMQIFKNEAFGQIRTVQDEKGEPWFCGADVCKALGYTHAAHAIEKHVDKADGMKRSIRSGGQHREMLFINESGLYALILGSKLKQAREFKHWITSEVLPAIRKQGGYMVVRTDEPDEVILSRALLIMQNALKRREDELKQMQLEVKRKDLELACADEQLARVLPKADYADEVLDSVSCLTTTQVAKELEMSAIELNRRLMQMGIQYWQSGQYMLYADYARRGFARNRTHSYRDSDGVMQTRSYLVWTERGRNFIHSQIKKSV